MDTALNNGDLFLDKTTGSFKTISGAAELLQRAMISLTVRKGSFYLDPSLGSELYKLRRTPKASLESEAARLVREALLPLPEVTVNSLTCSVIDRDKLWLTLELSASGERLYTGIPI